MKLIRNVADVNLKNEFGETPLYIATIINVKDTVQILCQHGADVDAKNFEFESPLHIAT